MSYNLNFDDIRNMNAASGSNTSNWQEIYTAIRTSMEELVNNEGFTGTGADSIKMYITNVHLFVMTAIETMVSSYNARFLLFMDDLYQFDSNIHAKLNEDALTAFAGNFGTIGSGMGWIYESERSQMQGISDLVSSELLSVESYVSPVYDSKSKIEIFRDEVGAYDQTFAATELTELSDLVAKTLEIATRLRETGVINIAAYQPYTLISLEELEGLANSINLNIQYISDNQERIQAAAEHQQEVWEQLKEEAAEQRKKEGLKTIAISAIAIASVVVTAGTSLPLWAVATPMLVYNFANIYEGAYDVCYGSLGDPYTAAPNPIRDTIFMGNQDTYDLFGIVASSVYTAAVPLAKYSSTVKIIQSKNLSAPLEAAAIEASKEVLAKELTVEAITDMSTMYAGTYLELDPVTTMLMGLAVESISGHVVGGRNYNDILDACEANRGAKGVAEASKSGTKTNFDNEIPRSGLEWSEYFKQKYGADNVEWVSNVENIDTSAKVDSSIHGTEDSPTISSKTNFDNEIPRSGLEWSEYFKQKYGPDNVEWVSNVENIDVSTKGSSNINGIEYVSIGDNSSIIYGELDSLGRTTGVEAVITQDMIGNGSPAQSSIKPAGFVGQSQGHARGHLLANQLGGSGSDPRNLVTIYQNPVNHPVMSSIEFKVRQAVEGGQSVKYKVTPIYEGNDLIPRGITIQAQGSEGFYIFQTILNRK